ncbi:MAG TPA: zinc ribbon domain-containing protein [Gammaproteobacteria bacterium]|nr:zinc ribbon domain-containing protein [Gammaproteobacteria bacterium]
MPLYEYRCQVCGFEQTVLQKIGVEGIKSCNNCQQLTMKRIISQSNFQLKGAGWFNDGYGSSKPSGNTKDDSKKSA